MNGMRLAVFGLPATLAVVAGSAAGPAAAPEVAIATADAFHAALESGDRDAALQLLDEHASIFESGGVEASREEYAAHHLAADIEFLRTVRSRRVERHSGGDTDIAWVATRSRVTGSYAGREIDSWTTETVVLRSSAGGWHIVHVHWSSQPAQRD